MAKKGGGQEVSKGPATINNRRASYDYHILDTLEVGLVLHGSEAKSLYAGHAHLTDSFAKVINSELWLIACDIEHYSKTTAFKPERRRDIKLLAHAKEIVKLQRAVQEKGLALVPLKIYFKNGKAKVLLGMGQGKKQYDKRQSIAERETKREEARARSNDRD